MRRSLKVAESAATSTERSIAVMADTAERQLRAYVAIERAWIEFPEEGVPKVTVVAKNAGQTPANELSHWIHQWVERYPLKIELPEPPEDFATAVSVLAAGATHEMGITHPKPIVKPWAFEEIGTEEATIYVYGKILYKDVFGIERLTRYRLMYGGPGEVRPGQLSPCESGNEMT